MIEMVKSAVVELQQVLSNLSTRNPIIFEPYIPILEREDLIILRHEGS